MNALIPVGFVKQFFEMRTKVSRIQSSCRKKSKKQLGQVKRAEHFEKIALILSS